MTSMMTGNTPCCPATEALGAMGRLNGGTDCAPTSFDEAVGESAIVSPAGSQTCLPQHQLRIHKAFSMSELARAAAPIEASLSFPVIEWSGDEDENDENDCDQALPEGRDADDSDDEEDGPEVISFRPGRSIHRKRSSPELSLRRTKSRKSSLSSLGAECRSVSPEPRSQRPPRPTSGGCTDTIPPSDSWGQFVAPKDQEGVVKVKFAVSLAKSPRSATRNRRVRISESSPSRYLSRSMSSPTPKSWTVNAEATTTKVVGFNFSRPTSKPASNLLGFMQEQ